MPPLTALRAFAAAAHHLSFAKAAAELHVTPAALSFQIKSLEEHLGEPVFIRLNRAIELTEAGRALLPGIRQGFGSINAAWAAAKRRHNSTTLTVTAGPGFTAKWLAPRLFDFASKHPETELRIVASLDALDFHRDDIDVAIRFGLANDKGLFAVEFPREWATPVMTPALAEKIRQPRDLLDYPLIHDDSTWFLDQPLGWAQWFRAAGLPAPDTGGPRFSGTDHAIDLTLEGRGITMGRISIAERLLAKGHLIAPLRLAIRTPARYRVLCPQGEQNRPALRCFLDWLKGEATQMETLARRHDFVNL